MTLIEKILGKEETPPDKPRSELMKGKILKLSTRGYGFLTCDDMPFTRIFFHWSVLTMNSPKFTELYPNMRVSFQAIEVENKGWRALMVKVDDNSESSKE